MSEIIDLTEENVVIMPMENQNKKKIRKPPTCGNCGIQGHNVRGCTDPRTMNKYRYLLQMTNRAIHLNAIINWLRNQDANVLQFLTMKYCHSIYKKHSVQMCISLLSLHIENNYALELVRSRETLQSILTSGPLLIWAMTINRETINDLYANYCSQFEYGEEDIIPNEAEYNMMRDIIISRVIPPNIHYSVIKRFHNFILYKNNEFNERQNEAEKNGRTIEYQVSLNLISETKQIDCPICFENVETKNIISTNCNHDFCQGCIMNIIMSNNIDRSACPMCRTPITVVSRWNIKGNKHVTMHNL